MNLLKFTNGNAKIDVGINIFSLPAGRTCPGASLCKSMVVKCSTNKSGHKIQDGPQCHFRCFAASEESIFVNVRLQREHNFNQLKSCKTVKEMVNLIVKSLPVSKFNLPVRIHASGDFFSQIYFDAWLQVAKMFPYRIFYGYTKSLPFYVKRIKSIPSNLRLVASYGGKFDYLIKKHNLRFAKVVFSVEEANKLGLEIDHDDSLVYYGTKSLALLLHGKQRAGTESAAALNTLKKLGISGYGKTKEATKSAGAKAVSAGVPAPRLGLDIHK